jgi:aspartate/methionine/tyrosine aminotransferase
MPRAPHPSAVTAAIRAPAFSPFARQLAALAAERRLIPLHVGDTYLAPPASALRIDLHQERLHRLGIIEGEPQLRRAVAARLAEQHAMSVAESQIFIVPGGTGGLAIAVEAVLDPGDELIMITPTWSMMFGIVERRGVAIREVSIGPDGWPETDAQGFVARLDAAVTERTAAVYVCDPNNPAGFVYPHGHRDALAEFVGRHGLWLISDIAYCDLVLDGEPYVGLPARRPDLADRCILVGTFTKSHGIAGHRTGYLVSPPALGPCVSRLLAHTTYHAPTVGQAMAIACAAEGPPAAIFESYRRGREVLREHLHLSHRDPQAGGFAWLDLRPLGVSDAAGTERFLQACLDVGVALAPGHVFGKDFGAFARLCYTVVDPEVLADAIQRINAVTADFDGSR